MKNAQKQTVGTSDKDTSPKRSWNFFPKTAKEIPPVNVLQEWGRKNLQYMVKYWETVLAKGGHATACLLPTDVICQLTQNIGQALILADDAFPLIPDLRLEDNWVEVGETLISYEIICEAGAQYRKLKPYPATILGFTKSELPPETREIELQIIEKDADCGFDQVVYDLYSPYIMKNAEVAYFSSHPDAITVWSDLCGIFYHAFRLNSEMKGVLRRYFNAEA